jgi:hypothetical protein
MIGIEVLLLVGLAAAQPEAAPVVQRQTTSDHRVASLDVPDEIAPAVLPYLQCKLSSAGIEVRSGRNGPVEPTTVLRGADCSRLREQAVARGERMLRDQRRGTRTERLEFLERTLASIDRFAAASTPSVPQTPQVGAPAPVETAQEEMLVVGQRLKNWRGEMQHRNGSDHCRTLVTSGDAEIDRVGCSAMAHCYANHRAGLTEAAARPAAARAGHPVYRLMGVCVRDHRDLLIADLAERRYRARQGSQNAQD